MGPFLILVTSFLIECVLMLCTYVRQYKVVTLRNHLALMAAHFLRLQGLVSDENNFAITANITYMICALMTCCLA